MCLPPPNVTGTLHLGHALGNSIQDTIARWRRMCGDDVLWLPGCDHAGIATQVIVEKELQKRVGVTRHQIGRKQFVEEVWKWKNQKGDIIYEQMKRLGSSLDWQRATFTLDEKPSYAVREAFIRLFDDGLIYRKERLVNWSCALRSAISDIEVDDIQIKGRTLLDVPGYDKKVTFGLLTVLSYPIEHTNDVITIATTRPETVLGDVAVAVHPNDSRYTHLHGKYVIHPLTSQRIPIILDPFVDREFGTGAVKITPAQDPKDFEVGERHGLPLINILAEDGSLINVPEPFQGLPRFLARDKVLDVLTDKKLLVSVTDHDMVLPVCSRSHDVIEPLLKDQWFVKCQDMAQEAIKAVKSKQLQLIPDHYEKQWYDWLENIRDWCISRQLWWGHQIPAYRVRHKQTELGWVCAHNEEDALEKACKQFQFSSSEITLSQDEDVLDTWFSSALFPFSVFGWPHRTDDLLQFYPTTLLETASDIMFFWVARMVMMGKLLTGKIPFKTVVFHSILRDCYGRKMSKSLGNVIDPLDVIRGISLKDLQNKLESGNLGAEEIQKARSAQKQEYPDGIPACGADALHFSLCSHNYKANYINVSVDQIVKTRQFCNKIWQTFKFICSKIEKEFKLSPLEMETLSPTDRWLLSRLSAVVQQCEVHLMRYELYKVTNILLDFWWHDLCDIYLEYSKLVFESEDKSAHLRMEQILYRTLETGLRMLAPFMPYLCEELYQRLPGRLQTESICIASYPQSAEYQWRDLEAEQHMDIIRKVINQLLSLRREFNLTKTKPLVYIQITDPGVAVALQKQLMLLERLSRSRQILLQEPPSRGCVVHHGDGYTLNMELEGNIDFGREIERIVSQMSKLDKELEKVSKQTDRSRGIPEHIVRGAEEKIISIKEKMDKLQKTTDTLSLLQDIK
ncbi:hypothetical protein LSH36_299g01010 [Paralvinella palmiformis]|uniref:Valine--tRNA ligase n=1 Tax=Paralvinella palmiformis TaxID=53620 RepID=A0AAD9N1K8_9ANNE|nr:hypothetical protein LSH36_299g01010 [Paralvinella palmiformis]